MSHRSKPLAAAWATLLALALAGVAAAQTLDSAGYFMQAKVTKVHFDGTIDFWVTSVQPLPRPEPESTPAERPPLPKVIATLELKSAGLSSRVPDSDLQGVRISLRGKCEDLDRVTREPVIQVRLGAGQRWQQANLEPENRAGRKGFRQIAATVCGSEAASRNAPADSGDAPR